MTVKSLMCPCFAEGFHSLVLAKDILFCFRDWKEWAANVIVKIWILSKPQNLGILCADEIFVKLSLFQISYGEISEMAAKFSGSAR